MDETDFELGELKVQLDQFSTTTDSKDVSVAKVIDIFCYFGKH